MKDIEYKFINYYECPDCHTMWDDVWDSMCDDECPNCGTRNISPYKSEDVKEV
jgi:predicted  nucleic acid-binding Zn-ribbon protein